MRLAYADPPYYGYGHYYTDTDEAASNSFDDLDSWVDLIDQLREFDGWALSMTSGNLHDILPLAPEARIAAWVKPFAAFKPNVRMAYTWEPVLFVPARDSSKLGAPVGRDHLVEPWAEPAVAENITMRKGLTGAKPERFCAWILDLLGWVETDEFEDVFPGTGVMDRVIAAKQGKPSFGEFDLFEDSVLAEPRLPDLEAKQRPVLVQVVTKP